MMADSMRTVMLIMLALIKDGHAAYYGTRVGTWTNPTHAIQGEVYVVDRTRIFIKGFSYDGLAPDAFFLFDNVGQPNANGKLIPDELGRNDPLKKYQNKDILLTLPENSLVTDITWLSVWCRQAGANLASLTFPSGLRVPAATGVGSLPTISHQVSSGPVTLLNSRTIRITRLTYDGYGPDAFFILGKGSTVSYNPDTTIKIPDENGGTGRLSAYTMKTITIQVPGDVNIADYQWFSIYCIRFAENFGSVKIPSGLVLPPYLPPEVTQPREPMSDMDNCQTVDEDLNVGWSINSTHLTVQLEGVIEENGYMSFGLSGQPDQNQMDDADVAVVFVKDGVPHAVDYLLNQKGLCSNGRGACSDVSQGGSDDIEVLSGSKENGITKVRYTRKLNTGDSKDKNIPRDGQVAVVWALGRRNADDSATKHYKRTRDTLRLDFDRTRSNDCSALAATDQPPVQHWPAQTISGLDTRTFRVTIGQSGGERGYDGITGNVGWGIAYYINKKLIPELTVKRGETYTFIIETGNNPNNSAKYHPFYITNDRVGGYVQLTSQQAQGVVNYAGLDRSGAPLTEAVGRLCVYERANIAGGPTTSDTFEDFFRTLRLDCVPGMPGNFTWTPDENTPDLVYYQCYTHRYFGWKIYVVDDYTSSASHPGVSALLRCLLVLAALLYL